jgi:hypothetical protein
MNRCGCNPVYRNHLLGCIDWQFQDDLYILVTDAGYATEPSVVWEKLNEVPQKLLEYFAFNSLLGLQIDGDTEYCNHAFGFGPNAAEPQAFAGVPPHTAAMATAAVEAPRDLVE